MTANKILNIGRAGFKILGALSALIGTLIFIVLEGVFKIFSTASDLDDGKEDDVEKYGYVGEEYWDLENPNAGSLEKAEAYSNGRL